MTNKEAKEVLEQMRSEIANDKKWLALDLAIKALEFIAEPAIPATTEVVISDDLGHEIKGFYDKGRDMIFTGYGIAPRRWFDAKYTITEMSGGANDGQM